MFASKSGRILFAGAVLLVHAGMAVPARAVEALPLPDAVLREVTASGIGNPFRPDLRRGEIDRLVAFLPTVGSDLNRTLGDFQPSMSVVGGQAVGDMFANSQNATNLALSVVLNGQLFIVSIGR